jgi:hypothetical protein
LKFYKSSLKFDHNRTTYKEFFWCSRIDLYNVWWFSFLEFLTPSTLWGHNFLNSIFFLTTFNVPNAPIEGVQVFLGTRNIGAFSLDLDYLECLSILSPIDMLPTPSRTQMWVPNRKQQKSKESRHVPWFTALWRG